MNVGKLTKVAAIGFGSYVIGNLLLFKLSLDGMSYWEVRGYITGIVRGAGDYNQALDQLNAWRNYWLSESPWAGTLIDHFYDYGTSKALEMYSLLQK
jgi:hypothetical protein